MSIEEQIQLKIQDFKKELKSFDVQKYFSFTSFSIDCNDLLSKYDSQINNIILSHEKSNGRISVESYLKLTRPCNECQDYLQSYIDRHIQNGIFD